MGREIGEILGGPRLTGMIQKVNTGVIDKLAGTAFVVTTDQVVGNKATYITRTGRRAAARSIQYGGAAIRRQSLGVGSVDIAMVHSFEEIGHDPMILTNLLGVNGEVNQGIALDEIGRRNADFAAEFDSLRIQMRYSLLRYGKIWLGADGKILPNSSGAAVTIEYGQPSDQQDQNGGIIDASWLTASTNIAKHINLLKARHEKRYGRKLTEALYTANILDCLLKNDSIKNLLNAQVLVANQIMATGEIPNGFMGLNWRSMNGAAHYAEDETTITDWWGDDVFTLTPAPDKSWYRNYEGSYVVPSDCGMVAADVTEAAKQFSVVYGKFAFANVSINPPGIRQFMGDTYLPVLNGGDLVTVDVTP